MVISSDPAPIAKGDSRMWENDFLCVNAHSESKYAPGTPKRKWTNENCRIPKPCLADHAAQDVPFRIREIRREAAMPP